MKNPKHSGWTKQPDGSHTAKIGRTNCTIYPPRPWQFWRGDHKGVPCHIGPGVYHTVAFHGSHSGSAYTLEGTKIMALWTIQNDLTGKSPPDSIMPPEELEAQRVRDETVTYVNRTYGER